MNEQNANNSTKKELIKLYRQFCSYIVETCPNYTDNDFNFDNFMNYIEMNEDDELRKAL